MKSEIINILPETLKDCVCTLRKTSKDDNRMEYMCNSVVKVINFDKVPKLYTKGKGWRGIPCSNDALYIENKDLWHFIEFKNGTVNKGDVYRKIYDSLIMLIEMNVIPNLDFARKSITYTLVYNSNKYQMAEESVSRDKIYAHNRRMAKEERKMFGIEKFEQFLFKNTHTYTRDEFNNNFVKRIEKLESEDGM